MAHRLRDGVPLNHGCYIIHPQFLKEEMNGNKWPDELHVWMRTRKSHRGVQISLDLENEEKMKATTDTIKSAIPLYEVDVPDGAILRVVSGKDLASAMKEGYKMFYVLGNSLSFNTFGPAIQVEFLMILDPKSSIASAMGEIEKAKIKLGDYRNASLQIVNLLRDLSASITLHGSRCPKGIRDAASSVQKKFLEIKIDDKTILEVLK